MGKGASRHRFVWCYHSLLLVLTELIHSPQGILGGFFPASRRVWVLLGFLSVQCPPLLFYFRNEASGQIRDVLWGLISILHTIGFLSVHSCLKYFERSFLLLDTSAESSSSLSIFNIKPKLLFGQIKLLGMIATWKGNGQVCPQPSVVYNTIFFNFRFSVLRSVFCIVNSRFWLMNFLQFKHLLR